MSGSAFQFRAGQRAFMGDVAAHRVTALITRRQYGKTTFAALISLKKMMKQKGHTVVFGSVKLDLAREMIRKESEAMHRAFLLCAAQAEEAKTLLETYDERTHEKLGALKPDDFAELYEAQRLEFRLYHSNSIYSRTKVVALTPEAVGETGDTIADEVGRVKNFRAVWEAWRPIIVSNPEYRGILTTTPPPDDTHFSFELLSPPVGAEMPVRPEGNLYRSDLGIWVRRVTAWDAQADGVSLYDEDTGKPITPEESRRLDYDKDAWDRNYGCVFTVGGTGACGLVLLNSAQTRGVGQCRCFHVENDSDFSQAVRWITENLTAGPCAIGADIATTTKGTSNPTAVSVVESRGVEKIVRAVLVWKTADPEVAMERFDLVARAVKSRKAGGPPRRFVIDATNERYFAQTVRKELAAIVPVDLVVASETIERPGEPEPITYKQYLGSLLVAELDDNHLWLPPERYVRDDWRLVKKEKGQFVCEPDVDGKHGDTFDSTKLAVHGLLATGGAVTGDMIRAMAGARAIHDRQFAHTATAEPLAQLSEADL